MVKINVLGLISIMALTFFSIVMTGCNDDNNDVGMPEIEYVRVTDPEKADSTFTQAFPGAMIAIMGKNLQGATALFINDQPVNFNTNMNTANSLIARIPTEENGFELTMWNDRLAPEIRIVTPRGEARYSFKVLAPRPEITRIAAPYPRKEGDVLTVYGVNFLDITRIYFSDVNPYPAKKVDDNGNPIEEEVQKGVEADATEFTVEYDRYLDSKKKVYVTDSEMKLTLPSIPFTTGYLVIETAQGNSVIDFSKLPPLPVLSMISSDMPVPGSTVRMRGQYFVGIRGIKIGDRMAVESDAITVSEDESELSFIMPEKPSSTTTISVVTESGESNQFDFYCYETLILDFDTMGVDEGHNPNSVWAEAATAAEEPYISDGRYVLISARNPPSSWWGTMLFWRGKDDYSPFTMPRYDIIPADTPSTEVYLMFECYLRNPFTKTLHTWVHDTNNAAHEWTNWNWDTGKQYEPELLGAFGEQVTGEWYTVFIPMSRFAVFEGKTYTDIANASLNRVRFMLNNYTDKSEKVFLCIDNVRIGMKQTFTPAL